MAWTLDTTHSHVSFAVRRMMVSTVRGEFRKYSGAVRYGRNLAGLKARGSVNRKDFGMGWNAVLETGGFAVGDKVTLELGLEASYVDDTP
jgi:polyisoprenoid-binding protein YceI